MIEPSKNHFHSKCFAVNKWLLLFLCVLQRYIPKNFEPAELKKVKLQETMSGLKHDFSFENEANLANASIDATDDESEIDPIDECKEREMSDIQSFGLTWMRYFVSLIWFYFRCP